MKKLLLAFLLFASVAAFSQDRKSLLRAAMTNVNAKDTFLLRDSVILHISSDSEGDSTVLADLVKQKFLTQGDADYMRMQLTAMKPHTWTGDSISHAVIVPSSIAPVSALSPKKSTKAWTSYFKLYKTGFYEVSQPVFSKDGTYAIIYTAFQCGVSCGNGGATLYHWEKETWKPVKNLFSWEK
jgi:hypothetical protein